jgi:hypothetical protein
VCSRVILSCDQLAELLCDLGDDGHTFVRPNVRGHRAGERKDATRRAASEAPGEPRC